MAGNTTQYTQPRIYLPAIWRKAGVTAGQTTGVPMDMTGVGLPGLPLPRKASLISVGLLLSAAVTSQFIRFELTINGAATGITGDMTASNGTARIWEFNPGQVLLNKGDRIGVNWGSHPGLTPSGSIDAHAYMEFQWE